MDNAFNYGDWDKIGSTYKQIIVFTSGKALVGFSKKIGFHERNDKIDLLTNWILRMYRDGYLNMKNPTRTEIDRIEYYNNLNGQHLMNLRYEYPEVLCDDINLNNEYYKKLRVFINKFYDKVGTGVADHEIYRQLYVKTRKGKITNDLISIDQKRFENKDQLNLYARDLINIRKMPFGEVEHFVRKYCQKHFGFNPDVNFE
ncbi:MAG: hypothetical protein ABJN36_11395 [Cyclobacteriaceae bacterium]